MFMATDPFSCPSIHPNSGQSEQWAWWWWWWGDRCQKSPGQEGALLESRISSPLLPDVQPTPHGPNSFSQTGPATGRHRIAGSWGGQTHLEKMPRH